MDNLKVGDVVCVLVDGAISYVVLLGFEDASKKFWFITSIGFRGSQTQEEIMANLVTGLFYQSLKIYLFQLGEQTGEAAEFFFKHFRQHSLQCEEETLVFRVKYDTRTPEETAGHPLVDVLS
ncbi:MAG: hypothetical protein WAV09_02015 [Minisyncoccia bacterium]